MKTLFWLFYYFIFVISMSSNDQLMDNFALQRSWSEYSRSLTTTPNQARVGSDVRANIQPCSCFAKTALQYRHC